MPQDPPLKDPKDFTLIGKPLKRLDTPNKVNGSAIYGIDAMLPGHEVRDARRRARCSAARSRNVDDSAAKAVPGVRQIVVLDDLVAVVGDHMWAAKKGLDALDITWDEGPNAKISSADIWEDLRAASKKDGVVAKSVGDIAKGLAQGERFDAEYELPFLAHATMEPMNCTVQVTPDCLRNLDRHAGHDARAGIRRPRPRACRSRRSPCTIICSAAASAGGSSRTWPKAPCASRKHVDGPVKVVWTREEDIQHDIYRPVYRDVISATLSDGKIAAWKYRVTGSSIMARWLPPAFQNGIDIDARR